MPKPRILVLSKDDDTEGFKWMSDGWNRMAVSHTGKAKNLMAKARVCIAAGTNVLDVIKRLKKAGFEVVRQ